MAKRLIVGTGLVDYTPEEQTEHDANVAIAVANKPEKIAKLVQDETDIAETKGDSVINALLSSSNLEINTYVENNITNITEAQEAFKKVFKLLKVLYAERAK